MPGTKQYKSLGHWSKKEFTEWLEKSRMADASFSITLNQSFTNIQFQASVGILQMSVGHV